MKIMTEILGEPGTGKTHQAHENWPNPLHLDTAYTDLSFRDYEIKADREHGESWQTLLKLHDWDEEKAAESYRYVTSWGDIQGQVQAASNYDTIIIDNSRGLKALAIAYWCEQNGKEWPKPEQFGEIYSFTSDLFESILSDHHLVVISQFKDEYRDGDKTGERIPDRFDRIEYKAHIILELEIEEDEDGNESRRAIVRKNKFVDRVSDSWIPELNEASMDPLLTVAGIPEDQL